MVGYFARTYTRGGSQPLHNSSMRVGKVKLGVKTGSPITLSGFSRFSVKPEDDFDAS